MIILGVDLIDVGRKWSKRESLCQNVHLKRYSRGEDGVRLNKLRLFLLLLCPFLWLVVLWTQFCGFPEFLVFYIVAVRCHILNY